MLEKELLKEEKKKKKKEKIEQLKANKEYSNELMLEKKL